MMQRHVGPAKGPIPTLRSPLRFPAFPGSRLLAAAVCLSLWACGPSGSTPESEAPGGPEPAHPAMKDAATAGSATSATDPHSSTGLGELPPGHPPIPRAPATAGAPAATPATPVPAASAPAAAGDLASSLARFGLSVKIPAGWKADTGARSMRLATFFLEKAEGDPRDAEVSVIPAMGSEQANIDRWRGQFQENPPATTRESESGGIKVTVTEMEGTFTGAEGGPQAGTRLWGAILRAPGASQLIFFKSWGPRATMEKWKASFDELAASVGPKA